MRWIWSIGQERYRERGWMGGHLKDTYKLCAVTNSPPPPNTQSLTPFLWENMLRTLVLKGFETGSLKIAKL